MDIDTKSALSLYGMEGAETEKLSSNKAAFKIKNGGKTYMMKIFGAENDYDIIPGERIYHTRGQIILEMEILEKLAGGPAESAVPVRNLSGETVSVIKSGTAEEM